MFTHEISSLLHIDVLETVTYASEMYVFETHFTDNVLKRKHRKQRNRPSSSKVKGKENAVLGKEVIPSFCQMLWVATSAYTCLYF